MGSRNRGWDSLIGAHRFRLVAEFKQILVSEIIDGADHWLSPRKGEDISYTTDYVARTINDALA